MSRAFVLLARERRNSPPEVREAFRASMREPREIPVHDAREEVDKPLITTTAKVISWLAGVLILVISLTGWMLSNRFETIVEARFDKFELRLAREYALKGESMARTEYELRHAELVQFDKQVSDRLAADERRLDAMSERLTAIERKH